MDYYPNHHYPISGMHSVREREPRMGNEMDVKFQVHCIEKEAYTSVLRSFVAQSELLSWGKEGLLTDLRRELCITDTEHAELLVKINYDESVQRIRNWRKSVSGIAAPTSVACASQKKKKVAHSSATKAQNQVQSSSTTLFPSLHAQFQANHLQDARDMLLAGNSMNSVSHNIPNSSKSKGRESHVKKDYRAPYVKKTSNFIEIRATDNVIQEVKCMIYGNNNPDPVQIEKAKSILSEHENSIIVALGKLSDVLAKSPNKMREFCSRERFPANGEETPAQSKRSDRFYFNGKI